MPQKPKATSPNAKYRTLTLDTERYQHMLDAPDLSEAQKTEMIEVLWNLIVGFVDLNFTIQSEQICGKPTKQAETPDSDKLPVLNSFQSQTTKTFKAAASAALRDKEAS